MNRNEMMALSKEQLVEIVLALGEQVKNLATRVVELEGQLNTNSGNSGKPPSGDGPGAPATKTGRERSGKSPGGQRGHEGKGLVLSREPDETVEHRALVCEKCGATLVGCECECARTSNVIDIEVLVRIVRHRQMGTVCPECGHVNMGEMPLEANHSMVYGSGLRSFVVLLSNYACVGMKKISELLGDVFGVPISGGTIANMNAGFAERSARLLGEVKARALAAAVLNLDETSMSVNGANHWLHTTSSPELTYMTPHRKRGKEGTDASGVLPLYTGVAVHDFWAAYFGYDQSVHAVCCAHLLRELRWVTENTAQTWAAAMATLLIKMKLAKEDCIAQGLTSLPEHLVEGFSKQYAEILALGETEAPRNEAARKQSKPRNLLERFIAYHGEITRFASNFAVPFSNNLAERDIRNAKVKDKVSGAFRSDSGIDAFARISSVVSTAKKQGLSVFDTLMGVFSGSLLSLFNPDTLATE